MTTDKTRELITDLKVWSTCAMSPEFQHEIMQDAVEALEALLPEDNGDLETRIRKVLAESEHGHVDVVDALAGVARAYAEAEQPEWEYRIVTGDLIRYTRARSEAVRARMKGHDVLQRRPRVIREAGPWLPVEEVPDGA